MYFFRPSVFALRASPRHVGLSTSADYAGQVLTKPSERVALAQIQNVCGMIYQRVKAGQRFTIRMESNPTTGYSWQLSKDLDNIIALITNAYISPDSKLMGADGYEVWTFKAIGEGQMEISMKYVRPWEKDQPARTNVFTIIVN